MKRTEIAFAAKNATYSLEYCMNKLIEREVERISKMEVGKSRRHSIENLEKSKLKLRECYNFIQSAIIEFDYKEQDEPK